MRIQKYPAPNTVEFTMPDIRSKNISYAKKLIDTTQNEEKSQSVKPTQSKHRWENLEKRMLKQLVFYMF